MIGILRYLRGAVPPAAGLALIAAGALAPVSMAAHASTSTLVTVPEPAPRLLDPHRAFRFEARMASPRLLQATWHIAKGYYMYRRSFSVAAVGGGAVLGKPSLPQGKTKHDKNFGDVVIYDSDVTFTVPVESLKKGAGEFVVRAVGQGCNEPVGVCFPPVTETATVTPAAARQGEVAGSQSVPGPASTRSGIVNSLEALIGDGSGQRQFLRPEQAFKVRLRSLGPDSLVVRFFIHAGYYLYKDKLAVKSEDPSVKVVSVQLPPGKKKSDPNFGDVYTFNRNFDARIALHRSTTKAREAAFELSYQGCAEAGICYPPIKKSVSLRLPGGSGASAPIPPSGPGSSTPGGGGLLAVLWPVLLAFGSGLLLTFTPCVLPMIPILLGIIVGQGRSVTRARGGALAGVYVLGTAVTYTAAGVVAGLTGDQLQAYFQNPYAIGLIAALLVLMALSMFGLYELKMPSAVQTRLQHRASGLKAGAFGGVFFTGVLSALIVGACVSPVLVSVLGLAIKRADPVLGGAIMFSMALGMGMVLIALGFGFGHFLPRTGAWMETIKHVFGVMLLGVAIYLLGAIPRVPVLYLWAALLLGSAFFVGARRPGRAGSRWITQAVSIALVAWSLLAVIGGLRGGRDILEPVSYRVLTGSSVQRPVVHVAFRKASTPQSLARLMQTARAEGKPVMIDYYADWCLDCRRMEKSTFAAPRVARTLNRDFIPIQVDLTNPNDPGTRAIKNDHGVLGPPAMLFFDRNGREVRSLRRYGYMSSEELMRHINPLRSG